MVVRVSSPAEIAASLPALLGYHVEKSIVLILLGGPKHRIRLTMRLDMPERLDEATARAVWQTFIPGVRNAEADEAVIVFVDPQPGGVESLADALVGGLSDYGVGMRDVLVVADGRFRSLVCDDEQCCPPQGNPVPQTSALAAAAVTTGTVIRATRDDLRAEIAPPDEDAARRAQKVVALLRSTAWAGSLDDPAESFDDYLDTACTAATGPGLSLDQAARLACLVSVGDFRDMAYLHMVQNDHVAHREVWASVCRQIPRTDTVVPHVLFALAAYLDGHGAMASVALEAVEEVDADHPSVRLISDVIAEGVPPKRLRIALRQCMAPGG